MVRVLALYSEIYTIGSRRFHTNNCLSYFYESKGSKFPILHDKLPEKKNLVGRFFEGCQQLKQECGLYAQEYLQNFKLHLPIYVPGEDDIVWQFNGTEKSLEQWTVTCDRDYNQGYSKCTLELSPRGTGIFHGELNCDVPNDGKTARAGYCNMTTRPKLKSFMRPDKYDWYPYNQLVLRVRGDGRSYMLNIMQKGEIDLTWYNSHHYIMYTRGGPYWQIVRIPFSKFLFASKGAIQDKQMSVGKWDVTNFGITVSDKKSGPFKLEIDYIAVCYDPHNFETFAYEMYDMSQK